MSQLTRRSPRSLRTAGGLLAAAALTLGVLTACGSDEPAADADASTSSSSSSAEATTESSASGTESGSGETQAIEVTSVDFSYELDEATFAPGTYEITLTNGGDSTHDLVVEQDGEDVAQSEQINPGESSTFEVTLEEGEYVFYCSVGNHRAMGMEVTVQVES